MESSKMIVGVDISAHKTGAMQLRSAQPLLESGRCKIAARAVRRAVPNIGCAADKS